MATLAALYNRLWSVVTRGAHRNHSHVAQLYREAQARLPFTEQESNMLSNAMQTIYTEATWSQQLYNSGVPPFLLRSPEFREKFIRHADSETEVKQKLRQQLMGAVTRFHSPTCERTSYDQFDGVYKELIATILQFVRQEMPKTMLVFHGARHLADLTRPHMDMPGRGFKRHVVVHLGPPNSGKTHEAQSRLLQSTTGIYCSPLRLLAWETCKKLVGAEVKCALLTGQESRVSEGDTHLSCTVEMTPLEREYHCAVIDEMQMIGDANRGYAWTRAFLGIRAPEVHVCGSTSCYTLAKHLCSLSGDTVEIREHHRLGDLTVMDEPVSLDKLEPGDCVVCFSRATALQLVEAIERVLFKNKGERPASTAVVYGSLPPETRTQQIEAFNSRQKLVMVASDVIGMGVNVRIKRILFHRLLKFDGTRKRLLTPAEIQQIAGRAGRYSMDCGTGFVGCLRAEDIGYLKRMMRQPQEQIERAVVAPTQAAIAAFADAIKYATDPPPTLAQAIEIYATMAHTSGAFEVCDLQAMARLARALEAIDLPNSTLLEYLFVPLGTQPALVLVLRSFALSHAVLGHVKLKNVLHQDAIELMDHEELSAQRKDNDAIRRMEALYQILDAYAWLWHKFPSVYVDYQAVVHIKGKIARSLSEMLETSFNSNETLEHVEEQEENAMDASLTRHMIRSEHC